MSACGTLVMAAPESPPPWLRPRDGADDPRRVFRDALSVGRAVRAVRQRVDDDLGAAKTKSGGVD